MSLSKARAWELSKDNTADAVKRRIKREVAELRLRSMMLDDSPYGEVFIGSLQIDRKIIEKGQLEILSSINGIGTLCTSHLLGRDLNSNSIADKTIPVWERFDEILLASVPKLMEMGRMDTKKAQALYDTLELVRFDLLIRRIRKAEKKFIDCAAQELEKGDKANLFGKLLRVADFLEDLSRNGYNE